MDRFANGLESPLRMARKSRRRTDKAAAPHARATTATRRARDAWTPQVRGIGRTKYLSLVDAIADAIADGTLGQGESLPSQRALAASLRVNLATVTKAIAEAGRRGLVRTTPGGGTQVAGVPHAAPRTRAEASGAIDLSLNIPPAVIVKGVLDGALAGLAQRRIAEVALGYAPLGGAPEDRAIGAQWIAARGFSPERARVLLVQGAHEGLFAALAATTSPGDLVACEELDYTGIRRIAEACRLKLVGVAVDGGGMRPDALQAACAGRAPKAILCTPVTLNPTTATLDLARRKAIVAIARRAGATLIEDDIYGHLAADPLPTLASLDPERVIYVSSLSKCVAPGLRIGYLAAPERLMARLNEALLVLGWTAPALHAALARELVSSGAAKECADAHRAEALRRAELARRHLGSAFISGPLAAYHGWLRLPAPWQDHDAAAALQRQGVLVSPAHNFHVGESPVPAALRLSLGATPNLGTLAQALATIAATLGSKPRHAGAIV